MRNVSKMARYTMLNSMRHGGGEMRGNYDGGSVRNGYGGETRNEGGNYARDNYGVDNRFRDRRGREHYDNGRFAPRNTYGNMGGGYSGGDMRGERTGGGYGMENRGGREGEIRGAMDDEDGMGMNLIGFDRPQEITNHYPTRVDYHGGDEMQYRSGHRMSGGAMGADVAFDEEIAKEWTKKMHNEDGSKGEHWNMDQIKRVMMQRGVQYNAAEIYAIMNALYSDYCKVLKKYGVNSSEAYLDLALAWLNDADAVPNKAMVYYENIVKH